MIRSSAINQVTPAQKKAGADFVGNISSKAMGKVIGEFAYNGRLDRRGFQHLMHRGSRLQAAIIEALRSEVGYSIEERMPRLLPLVRGELLPIEATDGTGHIMEARDLFNGHLDHNFNCHAGDKAEPTKEINGCIQKLLRTSTFKQMFAGVAADPSRLWFTEPQVIAFVRLHAEKFPVDGTVVFFPYKSGGMFFVAYVRKNAKNGSHRFDAYSFRHDGCHVWPKEEKYLVVVPELPMPVRLSYEQ